MPISLNLSGHGTLSKFPSHIAIYFRTSKLYFLNALGECKSEFLKFQFKLRSSKAFLPSTESDAEVVANP